MDDIQGVLSIISQFSGLFGDARLSNAVADCSDLLGFSSDQLRWSLSTAENPKGEVEGEGPYYYKTVGYKCYLL